MASRQMQPWEWLQCRGRNGWDTPTDIPDDMGAEALNVEFIDGALPKKRLGCAAQVLTGTGFFGYSKLFRFVPGQDPGAAELWIVDDDAVTKAILRVPTTTAATALSLTDAISAYSYEVEFAAMNGKLFIAYDSAVNRLHVYSPTESTSAVRRTGLKAPAAPTVADTGGGTYPAQIRYYRQQNLVKSGTVTLRRSLLSSSVSFTPSGAGTAARVTKAAASGENETHWVVFGSADGLAYYQLSGEIVVATTTYDDSVSPNSYSLNAAAPLEGSDTPFPSVKYLATDGTHLFGFGVWETTAGDSLLPISGRVYFTRALGSTATGDDEVVSNTIESAGWIDAAPNNGGVDRGIAGPLNDRIYAFQAVGIYMLVPTGQADQPFSRVTISSIYGSVSHQSLVMGEDEFGQPALYFLNPADGPRRIGLGRTIDWCGKDVVDVWATVNLGPDVLTGTTPYRPWGFYDSSRKLVMWWVATGSNTAYDTMLVFDVTNGTATAQGVRRGWATWTGNLATARCGVMFANDMSLASRGQKLVPYMAIPPSANPTLLRQDGSVNTDNGTAYQAYVRSKVWTLGTLLRLKRVVEAVILAKATTATLSQVLTVDFGLRTISDTASLAPSAAETRVRRKFDAANVADAGTVQILLGDGSALNQTWTLDHWVGGDEIETGKR